MAARCIITKHHSSTNGQKSCVKQSKRGLSLQGCRPGTCSVCYTSRTSPKVASHARVPRTPPASALRASHPGKPLHRRLTETVGHSGCFSYIALFRFSVRNTGLLLFSTLSFYKTTSNLLSSVSYIAFFLPLSRSISFRKTNVGTNAETKPIS